jgi:hypothetical protein
MLSDRKMTLLRAGFPLAGCTALFVAALGGCGSGDPFAYVPSSGTVMYDDETPIPASSLHITFIPVNPPASGDVKVSAPNGKADVDNPKDGSFSVVTSHKYADGLLAGKHKVIVIPQDKKDLAIEGLVPPECMDQNKTPLVVDTDQQPLKIRIKKPAGASSR